MTKPMMMMPPAACFFFFCNNVHAYFTYVDIYIIHIHIHFHNIKTIIPFLGAIIIFIYHIAIRLSIVLCLRLLVIALLQMMQPIQS